MTDLSHTEDFDLDISSGDFQRTDPTGQMRRLVLVTNKGDFKNTPLSGCNLIEFLKGNLDAGDQSSIRRRVRLQMDFNNLPVSSIRINGPEITVL